METQTAPTGNATAVPETDAIIPFTTPEEMEKYELLLDAKYVRLGKTGEPDPKHKKYFYQIVSMHPAQMAGQLGNDVIIEFGIQKFDKTKFRIEEKNGSKVRHPEMVKAWDEHGHLIDPLANFFTPAAKFLKEYQRDAV